MATTTNTSAFVWSPDVAKFDPGDVVPEALILKTSTRAGHVEGDAPAVRVAYVDDAPAGFVAEGDVIPEAAPALSEALIYTGKISQLVRISREQWFQINTPSQLARSVARAVTTAANHAYLNQPAPVAPQVTPPAGVLNFPGIVAGGAVANDLDELVDIIAALEGNGAEPSHILVDPTGWASLRKFKTGTGSAQALLGVGADDAERRLLDLPVIVTPALDAGQGIIVDQGAIVSAVGQMVVATSEHTYFDRDSIALRCTWRFGANVVRPDRVATFTITPPT